MMGHGCGDAERQGDCSESIVRRGGHGLMVCSALDAETGKVLEERLEAHG